MSGSGQLVAAAIMSFVAAVLHLCIIVGGPDWYRFFGAGEALAKLAESGSRYPALVTTGIASILGVWGLYALSGAGVIVRLPLLKVGLCLITAIYLVRGLAGLIAPFLSMHPAISQNSTSFWMVSSLVCTAFGTTHLLGVMNSWSRL